MCEIEASMNVKMVTVELEEESIFGRKDLDKVIWLMRSWSYI